MLVNKPKTYSLDAHKTLCLARSVLEIEAIAIQDLCHQINQNFVTACQYLLECVNRIVVSGIGKSGHIGHKLVATLASTGTPAFFLHPAEAPHGDLGMITRQDVLLILSGSGETEELIQLVPLVRRLDIPIIAMTGNSNSALAKLSTLHLDVSVRKEACPLGLAPTASTTAMLAMGDALALAVLDARGFTAEDFAASHPGGRLGRRLLVKIEDVMRTGDAVPRVVEDTLLKDALLEITQKRLGFTTVVSKTHPNQLLGIFTDGDLRRTFASGIDILSTPVSKVMTKNCKTIQAGTLAAEAIHLMEKIKSFDLPVIDHAGNLVGALNMHDLLEANVL